MKAWLDNVKAWLNYVKAWLDNVKVWLDNVKAWRDFVKVRLTMLRNCVTKFRTHSIDIGLLRYWIRPCLAKVQAFRDVVPMGLLSNQTRPVRPFFPSVEGCA